MAGNHFVQRLLLAIILIEIPFQLDINLGYEEGSGQLGVVNGLNVSATTLCLALLYASRLRNLVGRSGRTSRGRFSLDPAPLCYLAAVGLSALVAWNAKLVLFEFFLLLQAFLLYCYLVTSIRTPGDVRFVVSMLLIGLILEGLVMLGLRLAGHGVEIATVAARIESNGRISGTLGSPNSAGSYLSFVLAPALAVLLARTQQRLKPLATLAFALGGAALILTLSRGAWGAAALSIVILCFFVSRRGGASRAGPIVLAAMLSLALIFAQDMVTTRLTGDDGGAAYARIPLIKMAIRIISDYPLAGVGASNFGLAAMHYAELGEFRAIWLHAVHNKYLLIWSETGLLGLAAFLWFLGTAINRGWRCWKLDDAVLSPLALGLTAGIVGHMAHMTVDVFKGRIMVQMLWLFAGLITAMNNMAKKR